MKRKAFTLIELLVVIAIIAVLMGILMPALRMAKEHGQRAVCLSNLKQLTLGWIMYADEYDGRIVCGEPRGKPDPLNPGRRLNGWVNYNASMTYEEQLIGIEEGALYAFVGEDKGLYRCPSGVSGEAITYSIVDAMNGYDGHPDSWPMELNRFKIKNPSMRIVFIDEGRLTDASWTTYYDRELWWDRPSTRHSDGTCWGFADGHSEYWKWMDSRTVKVGDSIPENRLSPAWGDAYWATGNPDLHKIQKECWGKLGYEPTNN